jgi:DNA-binding IclR family transcriptional regulator
MLELYGAPVIRSEPGEAAARAPINGTQSVQRAVAVLRCIAASGPGPRLTEIAQALQIDLATAHRIVKGLCFQGMVQRERGTRRYQLGRLVYELGLAATPDFPLRDVCRPLLDRLAAQTGDSIFLLARSGHDVVCLERVEGGFPIQAHTLDVGARRPLGVGAGGLALLMALPAAEIEQVLEANAARYAAWERLSVGRVRALLALGREAGVAINDGELMTGVAAIGCAFRSAGAARGEPVLAAISIASISARMRGTRRDELAQALLAEVRALERSLAG